MKKVQIFNLGLLLSLLAATALAQGSDPLDSLRQRLRTADSPTEQWEQLKAMAKHFEKSNLDSSLAYAGELARFSEAHLPEKRPEAYLLFGWNCQLKLDFEQGLSAYFQSLELAIANDRQALLPEIYLNLAQLEHAREDDAKAKRYLGLSLPLAQQHQDSSIIMKVFNTYGNIYLKADGTAKDSALLFFQKSLALAERSGQNNYVLRAVNNIGTFYHITGELEKAIPYYQRAASIALKMGDFTSSVFPTLNIGHAYLAEDKPAEAVPFLLEARRLAEVAGHKMGIASTAMGLASAYEKLGDFKKAYEHHRRYTELAIEITESRYNDQIAEMQTRFETKEKEALLAQKSLELSGQEIFVQRLIGGALAVLLALLGFFLYFRSRQRVKSREAKLALQIEHAQAEKLRELDQLKSLFFANISHEFRTPLTLILSPLKKVQEQLPASEQEVFWERGNAEVSIPARHIGMMRRNAERLGRLIDQLLDLSKLESGNMQLRVAKGDVMKCVRSIAFSFESLAERRQIHFQTRFPEGHPTVFFDKDKLEKILINLLSNAFKFTPERGSVSVQAALGKDRLKVSVADSGPGISKADLDRVFERFYQAEGNRDEGTGIGLSLVRELVELHRGQISVESAKGRGTVFKFSLPVARAAFSENEIALEERAENQASVLPPSMFVSEGPGHLFPAQAASGPSCDAPCALIVEDNPDLRRFLAETMQDTYQVLAAANGREGLEIAFERTPDLIISDVMMPQVDGFELCETLKKDERTSHIPIILLTAKAGQRHKMEGLQTGADAYLTKPFDEAELLLRGKNLVAQRQKLREQLSSGLPDFGLRPGDIAVTSADERFLKKVAAAIEENIDNEFFSVEDFAGAVAFSRSQLHRKLKALTGKSPNELIREFRLTRAKELLEKRHGNVSEVAVAVGYNSLSYFTRSFKDAFGILPSEV